MVIITGVTVRYVDGPGFNWIMSDSKLNNWFLNWFMSDLKLIIVFINV